MAKKVLTNLDMQYNQLINAELGNSAGNPSTLVESLVWYDTVTHKPMYYDGTSACEFGRVYTNGTGITISGNQISVDTSVIATLSDIPDVSGFALNSAVVHNTGDEQIKGIKKFAIDNYGQLLFNVYDPSSEEFVSKARLAYVFGTDEDAGGSPPTYVKGVAFGGWGNYNPLILSGSEIYYGGTSGQDCYKLVNSSAKIVDARLSSNIARTSQLPTKTSDLTNDSGFITSGDIPTKISDLTDDTATYPIDKADTLTGLTATITELNYTDGVTSSIQTQLNGKQPTIDSSHKLLSDLVDDTNQTHKFATSSQLSQIATNQSDISTINGKIPSQASSSNQLADKNFVNSSISTNTAYFDGTWDTHALIPTTVAGFTSLGLPEPTNNNYLVVKEDETQDGGTWRYKYVDDGTAYNKNKWHVEYEVNETPLTAAQLAALNSGITANTKVTHTDSTQVGSGIKGVYVASNGSVTEMTYSVSKDVPSNAVFTDTTYTFGTGSTNGSISVTPSGGSASDVQVKGLGSAAYTASTDYATSAQGAKADTAVQKYTTTNPSLTQSGGLCTWTVTHNLGTRAVNVSVYESSTYEDVIVDVVRTSTSVVTIKINSTANITAGTYTVVVHG